MKDVKNVTNTGYTESLVQKPKYGAFSSQIYEYVCHMPDSQAKSQLFLGIHEIVISRSTDRDKLLEGL